MSEQGFICELCQRRYSTQESFLEHLNEHSVEEVGALRKLAELSITNEEGYKELCWELLREEYFLRRAEKKEDP